MLTPSLELHARLLAIEFLLANIARQNDIPPNVGDLARDSLANADLPVEGETRDAYETQVLAHLRRVLNMAGHTSSPTHQS